MRKSVICILESIKYNTEAKSVLSAALPNVFKGK